MLRKFLKSERGSVTVIVALTMTVLLGFTSLAVDYGSLTNERSLLQNAADAAALAGVVEGEAVAREYVLKNTTDVSAIEITKPTNETMKVTIHKDAKVYFSQILTGDTTKEIVVTATAEYAGRIQAPGYAVWAEDEISLKNKAIINGNVHSNTGNFNFDDEKQVTINGNKTSDPEAMPDYSHLIKGAVPLDPTPYVSGGRIEFDSTDLAGLAEDIIYYIDDPRPVVFKKNTPLRINLIANGSIEFNGSGANVDAKVLYSTNSGGITLNGSGGDLNVLAYAPNGPITWNGSGSGLNGAIIGTDFIENGSKGMVTYDENVVGQFARLVPRLIE